MVEECEEEEKCEDEEETVVTEEEEAEEDLSEYIYNERSYEVEEEPLTEYIYDERSSEVGEEPVTEETYRHRRMRSIEIERMREQREVEDDTFNEQHSIYQENDNDLDDEELGENREAPSVAYVTQQLGMRGITMEHLVSASLRCVSAYDSSMMQHDSLYVLIAKHINFIVYEYITEPCVMDIRDFDRQRSLEI